MNMVWACGLNWLGSGSSCTLLWTRWWRFSHPNNIRQYAIQWVHGDSFPGGAATGACRGAPLPLIIFGKYKPLSPGMPGNKYISPRNEAAFIFLGGRGIRWTSINVDQTIWMMNNEEYVRAQFSLSQRLTVFITTQLVNDTTTSPNKQEYK
jgi:hypothetical protein